MPEQKHNPPSTVDAKARQMRNPAERGLQGKEDKANAAKVAAAKKAKQEEAAAAAAEE